MLDRKHILLSKPALILGLAALLTLTLTAQDAGVISGGFLSSGGGSSQNESVVLEGSLGGAFDLTPLSNGEIRLNPGGFSPMIKSTAAGDFDLDGTVGFSDFLIFAAAFGSRTGDPAYRQDVDLDQSGEVDFTDFLTFAAGFGK